MCLRILDICLLKRILEGIAPQITREGNIEFKFEKYMEKNVHRKIRKITKDKRVIIYTIIFNNYEQII